MTLAKNAAEQGEYAVRSKTKQNHGTSDATYTIPDSSLNFSPISSRPVLKCIFDFYRVENHLKVTKGLFGRRARKMQIYRHKEFFVPNVSKRTFPVEILMHKVRSELRPDDG
jgi:hypothetical protein